MNHKLIILFIFSCCLGIFTATASQQSEDWVKLHGTVSPDGSVKLYWETRDWPADLSGFHIMRRIQGTDNWQTLSTSPLRPEIIRNKDWEKVGVQTADIPTLQNQLEAYMDSRNINDKSSADLLPTLQANGGLASGDRLSMKLDYTVALITNFAYIDHQFDSTTTYEYGLFSVNAQEETSSEPLAVYTSAILTDEAVQIAPQLKRKHNTLELLWDLSKEQIKQYHLFGFNVYKQTSNDAAPIKLVETPIGAHHTEGNQLIWIYDEAVDDKSPNARFFITAVDVFQREFAPTNATFTAADWLNVQAPVLQNIQLNGTTDVQISWEANTQNGAVKGFIVERMQNGEDSDGRSFVAISEQLPPDASSFFDQSEKQQNEVYTYRVVAVGQQDDTKNSAAKTILYMSQAKPPASKNTSAQAVKVDGKTYIRLQWDAKTADDQLTRAYRIYSDEQKEGTLLMQTNIDPITKNNYLYELHTNGGRNYQFKVAPIGTNGIEGDAEVVNIKLAPLKLLPVQDIEVQLNNNNQVILNWAYLKEYEAKGFLIFMNGEQITKASANSRTHTVRQAKRGENGLCRLQIQALGTDDTAHAPLSLAKSVQLPKINTTPTPSSAAVTKLEATFVQKEGKQYVQLNWKKIDIAKMGVAGYVLFADYAIAGRVMRLGSLPLILDNQYLYELPEQDNRNSYTFKVAPLMDANKKAGRGTEVSITR